MGKYGFITEVKKTYAGYVEASSEEEAKEKIKELAGTENEVLDLDQIGLNTVKIPFFMEVKEVK